MNSIDTLFQRLRGEKRAAFMPFISAGDPDANFTRDILPLMGQNGADIIEVGFPFSDPIADGPVIQASYTRALQKHLKLDDIFLSLGEAHKVMGEATPRVGMVSYSIIYRMGVEAFITRAQASGLSGVVVPDLPAEEAGEFSQLCKAKNFHPILLVTPTTTPERAEIIVKACGGFVYVVSVVGITGARTTVAVQLEALIKRLRTMTDLPLCVGFGVSQPEHVRAIAAIADGVIVGSALVKHLENSATAKEKIIESVRSLSAATRK